MKSIQIALTILSVILSGTALAEQAPSPAANPHGATAGTSVEEDTPAQQRIVAAQLQIKANPKKVQAYNELAISFLRRARETADPSYLKDADTALAQGLKLDSEDFQLRKTQVALMLSHRRFIEARDRAKTLNRRTPDDVMIYGYLAETDIALGDYSEAERNAQWMMNMRPNNTPALLLGASLRKCFGDARGAVEFLNRAYSQTSPTEVEDLAWIANQIASIQIEAGETSAAEETLVQAEQLFPRYPYTMENLARLRMEQNRVEASVQQWKEAILVDHDPSLLFELARAQEAAGHSKDAQATYAELTRRASEPNGATDASRLDLILMFAMSPVTASQALKLAEQEMAARQDIWTLDAYAWALYANARFQDAYVTEQKAIAVGIQDAQIFNHAAHIAQKLNRSADAVQYFRLSLQSNPSSPFAADALKSVNLTAETEGHEQDAPALAPGADLSQVTPLQSSAAAVDEPIRKPSPISVQPSSVVPEFAPIPEALLTPQPTGTGHAIRNAQATAARNPKDAVGYAVLGAAYFQRARETGDVADYQLAEESLIHSLDLDSTDFSADAALGSMSEVYMGEHRFAEALRYAQKALSLETGDVSPFAIVGDAYADMGEYDKAAAAYGRLTPRDMLLSPRAAYARDSRLSYLKFIAGDTAGAISLMKIAVTEGVEAQLPGENLAWLYYELGEYATQAGDAASADAAYLSALKTHPGDYRALAALAKLRGNYGRYTEAIFLYQKAIAVVPMPSFSAELGDLYETIGDSVNAQKQYALVEYIGLLGHINQVLHNRDLALFYADHERKLPAALDLAQKELEVRHDVYTYDTLAWVLYKNGKLPEAAEASEKATRFGTRDPLLLFHAAMIAERFGQTEKARRQLQEALQINPHFHLIYAATAQQRLNALAVESAAKEGPIHAR